MIYMAVVELARDIDHTKVAVALSTYRNLSPIRDMNLLLPYRDILLALASGTKCHEVFAPLLRLYGAFRSASTRLTSQSRPAMIKI